MKKLALFLIVVASLSLITGCSNKRKTVTRFAPKEDTEITSSTEESKTTVTRVDEEERPAPTPISISTTSASTTNSNESAEFSITSSGKNTVESSKSYQLIEGTTPKETDQIVVNNYPLSKYQPGDTDWSYIAAVSLGTLKTGENKFTVKALDEDGDEIASETVTIVYQGGESGTLTPSGSNMWLAFLFAITASGLVAFRRKLRY